MEQASLLPPVSPPAGTPNLRAVGEDDRRWTFEVIGTPVPQGSMKGTLHRKTGRVVTFPSNAKKLKPWREQIALTAKALRPPWVRAAGEEGIDGPVFVALTFVRRRPAAHLLADGSLSGAATRFPDTAPDIDKLTRAMLDGLTGVAFVNDSRVVSCTSTKRWAERGEPEKVEVEVTAL